MSSQMTNESPRQGLNARQAETVEKLLVAGLIEVREVGHEALTIRTVAQRAGVSPATAYTYLASKNHLFAELFWRHLSADDADRTGGNGGAVKRVQNALHSMVARIVAEPELAAAVTPALLGADPDVARLRLRIGGEFLARFEAALREPGSDEPADPAVLEVLVFTFSGALLQAGMGLLTYDAMADRLESAVAVILRGNEVER
jgi:AcrR family transcriptional regulator